MYGELGSVAPDLDDPQRLVKWFDVVQKLNRDGRILAYHDRSDGGLFVTLCEMAFAARAGLEIVLPRRDVIAELFNEELGAVLQVRAADLPTVREAFNQASLGELLHEIGRPVAQRHNQRSVRRK